MVVPINDTKVYVVSSNRINDEGLLRMTGISRDFQRGFPVICSGAFQSFEGICVSRIETNQCKLTDRSLTKTLTVVSDRIKTL